MNKKCELNMPRMPQMANPLAGFRGEGRDRPTHFLAASAAYAIDGTRRTDMVVAGH